MLNCRNGNAQDLRGIFQSYLFDVGLNLHGRYDMYTDVSSQALDTKSVVANRGTLRTISVMEAWQDRAKAVMKEKGITQESLKSVLGVSTRGAVGHYLSGRREPSIQQLTDLASHLGVRIEWLIRGEGKSPLFELESPQEVKFAEFEYTEPATKSMSPPHSVAEDPTPDMFRDDELEFFGHMDAWDSETPLDEDEVELPLFREVELAAGGGATQVIENQGAKLRFAKSTLSRAGVPAEAAACAFVRGNSMEPVMPDNTCVGVNTADKSIRDGEIYAIDHGGMLRVKYLHRRPGGGVKIVSQNSSEHPVEELDAQEMAAQVRVIGRVFWWSVLR